MSSPHLSLDRRQFVTAAALTAGATALGGALLPAVRAAAAVPPQVALPQRGSYDTAQATAWTDGFVTGNGTHGAVPHGTPALERVVLNHHSFVLPNGTRDLLPPVLSGSLDTVRDKALAGDYWGAAGTFAEGWSLRWTQTFHPGYELRLNSPAMTTADNYARIVDYRTGEVTHTWTDSAGTWKRHVFASRADDVVVHELLPATGQTVNTTVTAYTALDGAPADVTFTTTAARVSTTEGTLDVRGTYPAGQGAYGFEGVTRVVVTGSKATVTASGGGLVVAKAAKVLLLTKLGRYENATGWNARPLQTALAALPADYTTLLGRHTPLHQALFDSSSLDLGVSSADRQLSTGELIARQNGDRSTVDLALLERMYDSGRYLFASSSGLLPPRLTGLWTGSWNAAWADDITTDANINLQVAGGNLLGQDGAMNAYFTLVLGQLADWRDNATRLYGARGFLAPTRTDGEHGHMLHFDGGFPGQCWTGGADWLLYPLLEHYQVTGDAAFLRDKLGPALMELALFYEDFLTRTDSSGKAVFVPSFSVENSPSNTGQMLSVNATGDIMAGRHALQAAIDAANALGLEQGSGQGVARWTALLGKLPDYTVNGDGALAEWSWPGLQDRYNHRHVQHLYGAWPLHEINPEERPDLVRAAGRALDLRGDENYSAHGSLHRALARARLKDGAGVLDNIRKILGSNMVWRSLVTSHNPDLTTYNCDAANALPGVLAEALLYTRPGVLEILPALPEQIVKGTVRGVRGRNRVLVESLAWDTSARTATATLVSDTTQTLTFICRRGIAALSTTAATGTSPLGAHARTLTLTAGTRTTVTVTTLAGTYRLVNRAGGQVLDVANQATWDGAQVVQWPWNGGANQKWQLLPDYDGSFRLANANSGKVLDDPGSSPTPGQALDQWTDTRSPNQWWNLVPAASGYVRLVNVSSGLCLDVAGDSPDAGAAIVQAAASGAPSQDWTLVPV